MKRTIEALAERGVFTFPQIEGTSFAGARPEDDVCDALDLDLGNTTKALLRLDEDEQALISIQGIHSGPGNPMVNVVNESGLYSLVLGSRKPEAKRFKKWVTSEVLRRGRLYIKQAHFLL